MGDKAGRFQRADAGTQHAYVSVRRSIVETSGFFIHLSIVEAFEMLVKRRARETPMRSCLT